MRVFHRINLGVTDLMMMMAKDRDIHPDLSVSNIAFQETLELLDWKVLCNHLASFASTSQGKRICRTFLIPEDIETTK